MGAEIRLLGGFSVLLDGRAVADASWSRRHAAALVKLLALGGPAARRRVRAVDGAGAEDLRERARGALSRGVARPLVTDRRTPVPHPPTRTVELALAGGQEVPARAGRT